MDEREMKCPECGFEIVSETAALAPASAYVLAIQQSVGSILSQYSANKILDRAKEIANGH